MNGPPYAITMWDFSWLERRWPGAGYEDGDRALEELLERGEGHLMEGDSLDWMQRAIAAFKQHYPALPATFSWCGSRRGYGGPEAAEAFAFLDFLEPHIWMVQADAARYEHIHWVAGQSKEARSSAACGRMLSGTSGRPSAYDRNRQS